MFAGFRPVASGELARQVRFPWKSDNQWNLDLSANSEVIPKAVDLMHTFAQDSHDPELATLEMPPIDEMMFMAKEEALDAEFGRNGS